VTGSLAPATALRVRGFSWDSRRQISCQLHSSAVPSHRYKGRVLAGSMVRMERILGQTQKIRQTRCWAHQRIRSITVVKWASYTADGAERVAATCGRHMSSARLATTHFRSQPGLHTTNGMQMDAACVFVPSPLQDKRLSQSAFGCM